jgi:hypothetical protein
MSALAARQSFSSVKLHDLCKCSKTSTFRYQSIRESRVADLTRAFAEDKLLRCGELPTAALQKILTGATTARLIKPRYRALLL